MSIEALVNMTRRYGENEEYVVAGSGNASYKENDVMYITASGTELAGAAPDGLVAVDLRNMTWQKGKRPSIEVQLHALIPYKYVLHLHPAIVNGLTCSMEYERICKELFPDAVCVGAAPPGPALAKLCRSAFEEAAERTEKLPVRTFPQTVFLQNHGIIASADTVGEIDDLMTEVIDKLTAAVTEFPDFTDPAYCLEVIGKYKLREVLLTPEQEIYPDDERVLRNTAKIAVYAKTFGGINPLKAKSTEQDNL